ncbi:MAG: PAS domain S-box protein [Kiritimatiellae bacterium]|jgi:PAS domain S-box-containing protein|nr:PAS domain S-box protein [Kiritimatiellia bacterium]
MQNYFDLVAKNISNLDAENARMQLRRMVREMRFFQSVFQTLNEGILVIDPLGSLLYANVAAEKIASFSADKSRGKHVSKIMPDWNWPSILGTETKDEGWLRASEREIEVDYPERKILSVSLLPADDGVNVAIIRDITSQRAREADALELGRTDAVRELASGVAHEIGNPLNALSLNLQLLQREFKKEENVEKRERLLSDIEIALNQVKRISSINKSFLNALRPVKPNFMAGSLADPLKHTLAELKTLLESRDIRVCLSLPPALPSVMLDSEQMQQVFFNLIKNALEVMKDGSELEITLSSDDEVVTASFKDNGTGMTSDTLATIFEAYKTTKSSGNGLGLMVSKRIVRSHGGNIDVETKAGEGTRFMVHIPRISKRVRRLNAK